MKNDKNNPKRLLRQNGPCYTRLCFLEKRLRNSCRRDIGDGKAEFPVFKSFDSISGVDADVIIDFSHPSVLSGLLEYASAKSALRL